jgi:hypothetical protein
MSTYNAIAWLPLCAGLTGIGLVASWFAMRKRGLASGLRGAAWSLLPLAAYLTGSIGMFWKIGTAIGDFAASFAFSARAWSGVGVAALAAVLFIVSGTARRRRKRARRSETAGGTQPGRDLQPAGGVQAAGDGKGGSGRKAVEPKPAKAGSAGPGGRPPGTPRGPAEGDDDMREVEEILRRRGIS